MGALKISTFSQTCPSSASSDNPLQALAGLAHISSRQQRVLVHRGFATKTIMTAFPYLGFRSTHLPASSISRGLSLIDNQTLKRLKTQRSIDDLSSMPDRCRAVCRNDGHRFGDGHRFMRQTGLSGTVNGDDSLLWNRVDAIGEGCIGMGACPRWDVCKCVNIEIDPNKPRDGEGIRIGGDSVRDDLDRGKAI